jgi:hypothetical protein
MGLFSKELLEMDGNTVQLMIDEMQEIIDRQNAELEERKQQQHNSLSRITELEARLKKQGS